MEIESILDSVKKRCGLEPEVTTEFDADLIDTINSILPVLTQLGVGPREGYAIHGNTETWSDFFGDSPLMNMAKTYVTDRCRLIFDANGLTGSVVSMIQDRIKEFEWRLNLSVECTKSFSKEEV